MTTTECINTIRCLAADVVRAANSGHPGAPMGMAPIAHLLWAEHMLFNPREPGWVNRDRFVLSNGHACALQYSMLHLAGYDLPMTELKRFRQLHSKTPGHPERDDAHPGIEVTTGPLGQGIAQAVGLALTEKHMAEVYNTKDHKVIDHYTYVFCGDGCLQEGVSCEATSLAGHLGLGKLILVYDDNEITIDGPTSLSYSDDNTKKFESLGWHTVVVKDGNTDVDAMNAAVKECKSVTSKPSIIILKTIIGYGSKIQNTAKVHGAPLAEDDIKQLKTKLGMDPEATFAVSDAVYATYRAAADKGAKAMKEWETLFASYAKAQPEKHAQLSSLVSGKLPDGWATGMPMAKTGESLATRKCSENALSHLVPKIPFMIGGSADLTPSNLTKTKGNEDISKDSAMGRYIRFGVREHAMVAIGNGMACYAKGVIPFVATFFNFVAYAWGAVRVGALSQCGTIIVATHDSIGVGEDGPTHQPVELHALCRATPNLYFFRPADQTETSAAYMIAVEDRSKVAVVALSRQNVPGLARSSVEGVKKGGYCVMGNCEEADLILIGTGTEVSLCMAAAELVEQANVKCAVVSMPCTSLFDAQSAAYKATVLKPGVPVLSVEPYNPVGWATYSHYHMGLKTFGASAPAGECYKYFGLTKENIKEKGLAL
eukprot:gene11728-18085_t